MTRDSLPASPGCYPDCFYYTDSCFRKDCTMHRDEAASETAAGLCPHGYDPRMVHCYRCNDPAPDAAKQPIVRSVETIVCPLCTVFGGYHAATCPNYMGEHP